MIMNFWCSENWEINLASFRIFSVAVNWTKKSQYMLKIEIKKLKIINMIR